MPQVVLEIAEWNQVLAILAKQPWDVANPLLLKIGMQLRTQEAVEARGVQQSPVPLPPELEPNPPTNSRGRRS